MLSQSRRLYDIFVRHQTYIEGVKHNMSLEFNNVQYELNKELVRILAMSKYSTLDGLTKVELNRLLRSLRDVQNVAYSVYTKKIADQLKQFMVADQQVTAQMLIDSVEGSIEGYDEAEDKGAFALLWIGDNGRTGSLYGPQTSTTGSLWATIANAPIPANSLTIGATVSAFISSSMAAVESAVVNAWVDKLETQQIINAIVGGATPRDLQSVSNKVVNWNGSVLDTLVQHVSNNVVGALQSLLYEYYVWISVIDSRTTVICRSRDRNIYRFGNGPLPPAHMRCRSTISPAESLRGDVDEETFYAWIKRQPETYQNDILGGKTANRLQAGLIKADELSKFESVRPLTINQFQAKIGKILV